MNVENYSLVGFYDDEILLLTWKESLREGNVESVFENSTIKTFKKINTTENVTPWTDVSLLNERRI